MTNQLRDNASIERLYTPEEMGAAWYGFLKEAWEFQASRVGDAQDYPAWQQLEAWKQIAIIESCRKMIAWLGEAVPIIGATIWVGDAPGAVHGGKTQITAAERRSESGIPVWYIEVEVRPGYWYNFQVLKHEQKEWQIVFGSKRARGVLNIRTPEEESSDDEIVEEDPHPQIATCGCVKGENAQNCARWQHVLECHPSKQYLMPVIRCYCKCHQAGVLQEPTKLP